DRRTMVTSWRGRGPALHPIAEFSGGWDHAKRGFSEESLLMVLQNCMGRLKARSYTFPDEAHREAHAVVGPRDHFTHGSRIRSHAAAQAIRRWRSEGLRSALSHRLRRAAQGGAQPPPLRAAGPHLEHNGARARDLPEAGG